MGNHYTSAHLPDIALCDALSAHAVVTEALIKTGVIAADQDPSAVLSPGHYASVHRPGPAFRDLHENRDSAAMVQSLLTNGMAARVGKSYNVMAILDVPSLTCPQCQSVNPDDVIGTLGAAIASFDATGQMPPLSCVACLQATDIRQWPETAAMGFSYLGYEFWNWPPFNVDGWRVDIPAMISTAAQSRVSVGAGYI